MRERERERVPGEHPWVSIPGSPPPQDSYRQDAAAAAAAAAAHPAVATGAAELGETRRTHGGDYQLLSVV